MIAQWSDIHSEARGVVAFIAGRIKSGQLAPGDILLLAPRQEIGREVMRELGAAGVPGRSFFAEQELAGNPRKLLGSEAQQTFTLLSIAVEPTDPVSLRCWIGFGSPSLRHNEWERIRALCLTNGQSPADMLVGLSSGEIALHHTSGARARHLQLRGELLRIGGLTGPSLLDAVFPPSEVWAQPLRTIAETALDEDDYSASDLHEAILAALIKPELPTEVDYVRVMSLHKSKGLTAPYVFVLGICQGIVPTLHDPQRTHLTPEEHIEEQRRLLYVAITRPTRFLMLSSVVQMAGKLVQRWRMPDAQWLPNRVRLVRASDFIAELGPSAPATVPGTSLPS